MDFGYFPEGKSKENPPAAENLWNLDIFLKEIQGKLRRRRENEISIFPLRKYKAKSAGGGEMLTFGNSSIGEYKGESAGCGDFFV